MSNKWIIASNNSGKIKEINNLLMSKNIELIPQSQLNITEAEETATTFVENALLKAHNATQQAHLPALADDSGLVVPALNGEPGLYSARYAGTKNAEDNIKKLITNLKTLGLNYEKFPAYFYCIIVALSHTNDPSPIIAEGKWWGEIILTPRGNNGFGYDPVFYDPELKLTAAEMTVEQKQQRSHRGIALRKLVKMVEEK